MIASRGNTIFFHMPPNNSLVSGPWRAFWADTAPFKGPRLPCALLPELQRNKDTIRSAPSKRGANVPLSQDTVKKNYGKALILGLWKIALLFILPRIESLGPPWPPWYLPWLTHPHLARGLSSLTGFYWQFQIQTWVNAQQQNISVFVLICDAS